MKLISRNTLLLILLLTTTMGYAQTEGLNRKYSFTTLDKLWQNLIKRDNAPKPQWYKQAILDTKEPIALESHKNVVIEQNRKASVWPTLNQAVHKNTDKSGGFYVMKLPAAWVAAITHREVALKMYLSRETDYETPHQPKRDESKDDFQWQEILLKHQAKRVKWQDRLTDRRVQAHLELFLINLIRYREAPTLPTKCQYLKHAATHLKVWQSGGGFTQASRWLALAQIAAQASVKYHQDLIERPVCKVIPDSQRDISKTIEDIANQKISKALEHQQNSLVDAMAKKQADLTAMQQEATVSTKTSELLQLEMDMASASANLEFVHQDAFQLGNIVQELEQKNFTEVFSKIDDHFVPDPVSRVNEQNVQLQQKILALMKTLERIYEVANVKDKVAACQTLSKQFENLFKNKDLSATVAKDTALAQMNQCVTASQKYLLALDKPHPLEKQGIEFAKDLEQLYGAMLQHISTK
jgi:hypothetical protein